MPLVGVCSVDDVCFIDTEKTIVTTIDEHSYDGWILPEEDPVIHLLYASGGRPPVDFRMEAEWNNTVVAHALGDDDDYFTYLREDFRSDLYVHADVTGAVKPYHQQGAQLDLQMGDEDRPTWFWYAPNSKGDTPATNGDWQHGFIRPDGTEWTAPEWNNWAVAEVTNVSGEWSFWYDGSSRVNPLVLWDGWAEQPVFFGTEFDWAELPWE